jgi:hypothetical protein
MMEVFAFSELDPAKLKEKTSDFLASVVPGSKANVVPHPIRRLSATLRDLNRG